MTRHAYYGGVDLIRFSSALLVMLHHLGWNRWLRGDSILKPMLHASPNGPLPALQWGSVGVEVFFVISGLVIANSAASSTPIDFVRHRILRLYPAAWLCAALSFALFLAWNAMPFGHPALHLVGSLTLSPLPVWISPVYWTLAVEMSFYAAIAAFLFCRPGKSLRVFSIALLAWSGTYLILRVAGWTGLPVQLERPLLLRDGVFLSLGMFLWLRTTPLRRPSDLLWAAACAACGLGEILLTARLEGTGPAIIPMLAWLASLLAICAATAGHLAQTPRAALRTIGLMTYPLYLMHIEVGETAMRLAIGKGLPPFPALGMAMIAVLAASLALLPAERQLRSLLAPLLNRIQRKLLHRYPGLGAIG